MKAYGMDGARSTNGRYKCIQW